MKNRPRTNKTRAIQRKRTASPNSIAKYTPYSSRFHTQPPESPIPAHHHDPSISSSRGKLQPVHQYIDSIYMERQSHVQRGSTDHCPNQGKHPQATTTSNLTSSQLTRHRARDIKLKITTKNPACLPSGKRNTTIARILPSRSSRSAF
jgi:hypothetical protein